MKMARGPKKSPRNRLDPLKSRKVEHKVERRERQKTRQQETMDRRPGRHTDNARTEPWRRWPQ
jgi:hypothetical protein